MTHRPVVAVRHAVGERDGVPRVLREREARVQDERTEEVLLAYARGDQQADDLFARAESANRETAMREAIAEITIALKTLGKSSPWSEDVKATDDFLDPLFRRFFDKLSMPVCFRKSEYHQLVGLLPIEKVPQEICEKLDLIVSVAARAKPAT